MKTADCSSCGAKILWALTQAEKRIPLDAQPIDDRTAGQRGLFMLVKRLDDAPLAWPVTIDTPDSFRDLQAAIYQSHFAICPNAGAHRRSAA